MTPFNIWVQVVLEMWSRRPGENSLPGPSPTGLSCCIAHSISPLRLSVLCIYSSPITMPNIQRWDAARCLRDVSQQTTCFNNLTPICFPLPFYSLPRIHCSCQTCSRLHVYLQIGQYVWWMWYLDDLMWCYLLYPGDLRCLMAVDW